MTLRRLAEGNNTEHVAGRITAVTSRKSTEGGNERGDDWEDLRSGRNAGRVKPNWRRGERFDADAAKVGEMEQQCRGEDEGRGRIREMG